MKNLAPVAAADILIARADTVLHNPEHLRI